MSVHLKFKGRMIVPPRGTRLRLRTSFFMLSALLLSIATSPAQSTNAPARLSYDAFRMISDRNIFNPNRVGRGAPRTTRRDTTPAAHVESFSLVGIMSYEKGLFAFFEGTSADFKKVLQADAVIGQYKVASVLPEAVKLTSGTNAFELKVGMQMRREDEGEWFLSAGGEGSSRRRGVFSRTLTNGEPGSLTTTNGTEVAGSESEPEVVVVEGEPQTSAAEGNSTSTAAQAASSETGSAAGGATDPILERLRIQAQQLRQ